MTTTTTSFDRASRPTEAETVVTVDGSPGPETTRSFTHDALGNLTKVAGAATATTYSYDGFARLSRVAREVAGLPAPVTQDLSYDPFSRTHQKTTRLVAPGEVALTTRSHSYRGDTGELVATTEAASGALAGPELDTAYALGPAGTIAERVQQGGEEALVRILGSSPHHDVTYLTDTDGRVVATRSYDPWGVTRTVTGAPSYLGYQGDPTDADSTLVDMGARSYLPSLGRFLTQDPLRGEIGSPFTENPYIYAGDDPLSKWDPTGLAMADAGGVDGPCKSCPEPPPPPSETTSTYDYLKSSRCEHYCWDAPSPNEVLRYQVRRAGISLECSPDCQDISALLGPLHNLFAACGTVADPCDWLDSFVFLVEGDEGNAALAAGSIGFLNIFRIGRKVSKLTGTVWDDVVETGARYAGTEVPSSFRLTAGSMEVWVHPNVTKHLAQRVKDAGAMGSIVTQSQILSLQSAIRKASVGGLRLGKEYSVGSWELTFSRRTSDELIVLIHGLYKG